MIDVIVPVLGRPRNAQPLVDSLTASGADARLTFMCTGGDRPQIAACQATGADVIVTNWKAGSGDYAKKINAGFNQTFGDFVFMGADDIDFQPGWDTVALKAMTGRVGVVATNDQANRQVMRGEFGTHNLIRRAYIDDHGGTFDGVPGVVLYEGYDHWYVDRELCDVARSRRAFAFAKNSVVRHRHPIWRTAPDDATYRKGQTHARDDHTLYMRRAAAFRTRKRDIVR